MFYLEKVSLQKINYLGYVVLGDKGNVASLVAFVVSRICCHIFSVMRQRQDIR